MQLIGKMVWDNFLSYRMLKDNMIKINNRVIR